MHCSTQLNYYYYKSWFTWSLSLKTSGLSPLPGRCFHRPCKQNKLNDFVPVHSSIAMVTMADIWTGVCSPTSCTLICGRIWEKGPYHAKRDFLLFFKLSPSQGHKSPRFPTWFVDSLGLLLHGSNIRSLRKPPVPNSELPNWGIKPQFLNTINSCICSAQTGSGCGTKFLAHVAGWCENLHTKVEVCSCYTFQVISVLKWKFRKCAIWSLFSYPVTYNAGDTVGHWLHNWTGVVLGLQHTYSN